MKLQLESTTKIVTLEINGAHVPARIWEGHTETGIPVHAFITRVAIENGRPEADYEQFERELQQQRPPSPAIHALPLSLIL